jgi:hypothetical protein
MQKLQNYWYNENINDLNEVKIMRMLRKDLISLSGWIFFLIFLMTTTPALSEPFSTGAEYDSGWKPISQGETLVLTHNLGDDVEDYMVYMDYKNTSKGINQCYYSGNDFGNLSEGGTHENDRVGVYWRSLTTTFITLFRRAEDTFAGIPSASASGIAL